jgi:2'-5' RNA ligase
VAGAVAFGHVGRGEPGRRAGPDALKTNFDCEQSALFVPVPEAESVVGDWRSVHDPKARTGVPAHVTLIAPWFPPEQIKPQHLEELDEIAARHPAFDFALDRVAWFGDRVLWLAPNPDEPFRALTEELATHFGTPPWGGKFAEVVPHLTVGLSDYALGAPLEAAGEELQKKLPIACRARQVLVMCGDGVSWEVVHRSALV